MKMLVIMVMFFTALIVQAETVTVKIQGMTCMACVKAISSELKALGSIEQESVKVSLKKQEAVFTTKGNIPDSKIKVAVKKAGYNTLKILRK